MVQGLSQGYTPRLRRSRNWPIFWWWKRPRPTLWHQQSCINTCSPEESCILFFRQISKAGRLVFLLIAKQRRRSGSARKSPTKSGSRDRLCWCWNSMCSPLYHGKVGQSPGKKTQKSFLQAVFWNDYDPWIAAVHHCKRQPKRNRTNWFFSFGARRSKKLEWMRKWKRRRP